MRNWRVFFCLTTSADFVTTPLIPYDKPALTVVAQVDKLIERGLNVADRDGALRVLERVSYYRLSAYWHPFRLRNADGSLSDSFRTNASFEQALVLYEFDRELRSLVFDALERVEISLRTAITHTLALRHGPNAFEKADCFRKEFNLLMFSEKINSEIKRSGETFLKHFQEKYEGFPKAVPVWMSIETLSFGTLSKLFQGMNSEDQAEVSKRFGVHRTVAASWFHSFSYVRNLCAHHARLWNRELSIKPMIPDLNKRSAGKNDLWAWARVNPRAKNRVYFILYLLRYMTLKDRRCVNWARRLCRFLDQQDPRVLQSMGAPEGWSTHSLWGDSLNP